MTQIWETAAYMYNQIPDIISETNNIIQENNIVENTNAVPIEPDNLSRYSSPSQPGRKLNIMGKFLVLCVFMTFSINRVKGEEINKNYLTMGRDFPNMEMNLPNFMPYDNNTHFNFGFKLSNHHNSRFAQMEKGATSNLVTYYQARKISVHNLNYRVSNIIDASYSK